MTLAGVVLMLGLGVWQVERLVWKRGVLAAIDRAEASPAIPIPENPSPYTKVRVEGHFDAARAVFYGARVENGTPGTDLIVPLLREGAPPVLVDRGFVTLPWEGTTPAGSITVEGYLRPPAARHWFSVADDLAQRRFFTLDPAAIALAVGLDRPAPWVLVALGKPAGPGAPVPAATMPRPPDNHLGYAITWFGLALSLVVVFVLWWRKESRK